MFLNRVAMIAGGEGRPLERCGTPNAPSSNTDLCAKRSYNNLAMTLGSCKVTKKDTVGAGPQKMAVRLSLIAHCQFAGQSNGQ